uniref:NDP-hexose 2,3-dehydratase n=1 Tax=uncultured bacterium BAC-AB1442/1414/561 TaxID=1562172 RepID=A0A0C4S583_9BACT|nr:NDP-hexose 2,3-dehydratase [uncultured bacterium BAC-AB1442/1414/561]
MFEDLSDFHAWLARRRRANTYRITRVPLTDLDGWDFEEETGNLVHRSGQFYSIEGLEVHTDHRAAGSWTQPIIVQPEIGILGILIKEFDGVPHCLMQAKMEPGNINTLQLSPTVQATRSNYSGVHRGQPVPYLEEFVAPRRGRVVFDALQSEQGSWFLTKRNRNLIIEVTGDVPVLDDFCWLSVPQLHELLLVENLVNMDSRTVLAGLPTRPADADTGPIAHDAGALHSTGQILSWLTEAKTRYSLRRRRIPLNAVREWTRSPDEIAHDRGRYFRVIGIDVEASNREVRRWSQPMLAPLYEGVVAFLCRWTGPTYHVLVQARTEAGTADVVEMSPTVTCAPANYEGLPPGRRPLFLDYALAAPASRITLDVRQSEEGGRFWHAENRYLLVDVPDDFPIHVSDDFIWVSVSQLESFVRYGNHVSVEARSLLACLHARLATGAPAAAGGIPAAARPQAAP